MNKVDERTVRMGDEGPLHNKNRKVTDDWRIQEAQGHWLLLDCEDKVITAVLPKEIALEIANRHNLAPNLLMDEIERLQKALDESVKLQAHYANLINMHDGGQRRVFKTSDEWISRLEETGTIS